MIPSVNDDLTLDIEVESQPTKTYRMDYNTMRVVGIVDGLDAMKQAIFKILNTERYLHLIYSWNYGVEFVELYGENASFAYPEIKRRITEALLQDDRITSVEEFAFEQTKGAVNVSFVVQTTEGEIQVGKVVNL